MKWFYLLFAMIIASSAVAQDAAPQDAAPAIAPHGLAARPLPTPETAAMGAIAGLLQEEQRRALSLTAELAATKAQSALVNDYWRKWFAAPLPAAQTASPEPPPVPYAPGDQSKVQTPRKD